MTNVEAIEILRANYPDACYEQLREAVDEVIEAVDAAIEAVKALDVAGDTISRQAAVELATQYCPDDDGTVQCEGDIRGLLDELENMPSAQPEPSQVARDIATIIENEKDMRVIAKQQWIPISERLPEGIGKYLVWMPYASSEYRIGIAKWCDGYWNVKTPISAWMPLPEPYKGE